MNTKISMVQGDFFSNQGANTFKKLPTGHTDNSGFQEQPKMGAKGWNLFVSKIWPHLNEVFGLLLEAVRFI